MLFRSLVAVSALLAATPSFAQDSGAAIQTAAAAFVQPSNAERLRVITEQLTAAGLPYEVQTFAGGNDRTGAMEGKNVVITLPASGGEGDKDIVLTAHYDAVKLRDGTLAQGIVDNAGSVLAMIEAAKALQGQQTNHRLIFVLTDQEELGLIGAKHWLDNHDKARIHAVVNADVAAYGETVMYGENNGDQSAFVLSALRLQCAEQGVDCMPYPNYPPSDDRVFSAAGVPVVSLGTQDAIGSHQMWLAFNGGQDNGLREGFVPPVFQRIHSAEDKLELLNGADVARFGRFVADLALRLDRSSGE